MKTLLVFILSLGFLILGKPKHTHANAELYKLTYSSSAQHRQLDTFISLKKAFFIQNAHLEDKNELLSTVEDEEEDVVYSKKQLSEAKQLIVCTFNKTLFPAHHSTQKTSCSDDKQLSYSLSYKYIFHRALRL